MTRKRVRPFWPELPRGRADNDHVYDLLSEWARWADLGEVEAAKYGDIHSMNSVVHHLAVALIIELAPYADRRGFRSEIFKNITELNQVLESAFEPGYWRELAGALELCYSFAEPWGLSPISAKKYADELHRLLKDIALYKLEQADYWKERITNGQQLRRDSIDKKIFIQWARSRNIVVKNISEITGCADYPLESSYTSETLKSWYKEAMPNVHLKGGRPKKYKI